MSVVARRVSPRLDGEAKVRATLRFGFDHAEAGMLHGALLRSPVAAGRIVHIDTAAAAAMPGVRAILTAADVPAVTAGVLIADQPVLARDVVRYAGEPLAAVAADTPAQAARAAQAIEVAFEPLDVVELETALEARGLHHERYAGTFEGEHHPNLAWETVLAAGDVERALAEADVVVEDVFHTPRQYQAPIEPHCAVARVDGGRVVVHTPTQAPFVVRRRVATLLELRLNDVRVVVTPIGGGFGGKLEPFVEPIAALLARASGRPVRLLVSRRDDLQAAGPRENAIIRLRLGADRHGALLALEADCLLDAGAYASETPLFASAAPLILTGTYRIPNVRVTGRAVYTNTPPTASFRGVCGPYCCFALESSLDRVARELGLDRRELRTRNVLRAGERTAFGQTLDDACLDQALELVPWPGESAPERSRVRRGVGLAAQTWITNPEPGQVTLKLEEDGSVLLVTGAVEIGTGAVALAAPLLVAEALGVSPADVRVADPDTDTVAYDGGAQGSRTTVALAHAIDVAAASLREQILAVGAELLEADPETLADRRRRGRRRPRRDPPARRGRRGGALDARADRGHRHPHGRAPGVRSGDAQRRDRDVPRHADLPRAPGGGRGRHRDRARARRRLPRRAGRRPRHRPEGHRRTGAGRRRARDRLRALRGAQARARDRPRDGPRALPRPHRPGRPRGQADAARDRRPEGGRRATDRPGRRGDRGRRRGRHRTADHPPADHAVRRARGAGTTMTVGLLLGSSSPPEDIPRLARRGEELGFAELWLAEDYFTTGAIAATQAALSATRSVPVGTGAVSALARHPAVLAMEAATLARLHPGRFRLGVGLGVREWLRQMGVDPASPLTAMRETISSIRSLLAGETVSLAGRVHHLDHVVLEHPPDPPPPIVAAATGPRMLALSGELADGTVLSVLAGPQYVRWARERIDEGRARRADDAPHAVTTFALCNAGPDAAAARAAIRPLAALYLALDPRGPLTDACGISDELSALVEQADGDPQRVAEAMPDAWLDELVIAGDADECASQIQRLLDAGSTSVAVFPTPPDQSDEILEYLGQHVLPAFTDAAPDRAAG